MLVFSVGGKTYRGGELFGQVERDRETRVVQQSPKTSTTQMPRSVGTGKQLYKLTTWLTAQLNYSGDLKSRLLKIRFQMALLYLGLNYLRLFQFIN